MASSIVASASVASVNRATPSQFTVIAPVTNLRSTATVPATRKVNTGIRCMKVWPPIGLKKFETLSYLPPLTQEQLAREIDYLLRNKWIPCLEFEIGKPYVYRENNRSPGYYDGRYWTMWKLPMFGCTESSQVLLELEELKKAYPGCPARIIGFDNVRQVQCISFIAYKPPNLD